MKNQPDPNVLEYCSANAEGMGLDPVEAPNLFLGSFAVALTAITTASIKSSFKNFIQVPTQEFFSCKR